MTSTIKIAGTIPWVPLVLAVAIAVLNLNAQQSGEMMTRNPFVLRYRSKDPGWFKFNLLGRWAIVVFLLGIVVATVTELVPRQVG